MKQKDTNKHVSIVLALSAVLVIAATSFLLHEMQPSYTARNDANATVFVSFSAPRMVAGLVVDEKLKVITVEPGGAAEQFGIKEGDVVIEIDGTKVSNISELRGVIEGGVIRETTPTEVLSSVPGEQEIRDATAVAVEGMQRTPAESNILSIGVSRDGATFTIGVEKQPQKGNPVSTATPVAQDDYYF